MVFCRIKTGTGIISEPKVLNCLACDIYAGKRTERPIHHKPNIGTSLLLADMNTAPQDNDILKESVYLTLTQQHGLLPLIPAVAIKLLQLTSDDNADVQDLTKVVETEPTLAIEILKTVNSAMYRFPQKITSLPQAISLLGFADIHNLALKLLFYNSLIKDQGNKRFDLVFFWQHCLFVASLSEKLAKVMNYPNPEIIYTAGLIHDIGKLILEKYGIINYSSFIGNYAQDSLFLLKSETDFYGVTHEQVGYVFCREWQLPEIITAVVAHHNSDEIPDKLSAKYKKEIAIVAFADYLAWLHGLGSFTLNAPPHLPSSVLNNIPMEDLDLEALLELVDRDMRQTAHFYDIEFPALQRLRTNLVHSSIALSQSTSSTHLPIIQEAKPEPVNFLSNLTVPHQSLDPDIFIPRTLHAIGETFQFDRVFMLNMTSKQRSLVATYGWPESEGVDNFEIRMEYLVGDLLTSLRTQQADLISDRFNKNQKLLKELGVDEFIAIPVLRNNRLTALLYADNIRTKHPIPPQILTRITPIANELGSALYNAKQFEEEKSKAKLDPLTGLSNKRMLTDYLETVFQQETSQLSQVAVGFLDIDHFKVLNDNCGHQAGDVALQIVAGILREITRSGDFVGRYGGEEFLFVLRNSGHAGAYQYAERLRKKIEAKGTALKHRFKNQAITVSIGVVMYHPKFKHYQDLVAAADKAMYQAKKSGRNRVVILNN